MNLPRHRILPQLALAFVVALPTASGTVLAASVDMKTIQREVVSHHDEAIKRLQDWIALPSIAAENRNSREGAEYMATLARDAGFQQVDIIETGGKPGVFATLDAGARKTVGLYFMYDVKQYDPAEWSSPPLEARLVDKPGFGKVIVGRGAVNQKGPESAFLAALHAIRTAGKKMPVNLVMVAEGEEEIGSPHIGQLVLRPEVQAALAKTIGVFMGGKAYWMVVVPVYAPKAIALIAAGIPVDDALLARLQRLSALPNTLELVTDSGGGHWVGIAHGDGAAAIAPRLGNRGLPLQPTLVSADSREYVVLATRLKESERSAPVAAVLGYSLDDALRPYRTVAIAWASLVALGLFVGLVGALLIARGVARPIEKLAAAAHRIASGDYAAAATANKYDEVGQLASALAGMGGRRANRGCAARTVDRYRACSRDDRTRRHRSARAGGRSRQVRRRRSCAGGSAAKATSHVRHRPRAGRACRWDRLLMTASVWNPTARMETAL